MGILQGLVDTVGAEIKLNMKTMLAAAKTAMPDFYFIVYTKYNKTSPESLEVYFSNFLGIGKLRK